jgi:hypothetical protein
MKSNFNVLSMPALLTTWNITKTTLALSTLAALLLVNASPAPLFAADVSTSTGEATPAADQDRSLINRRSGDFSGSSNVSATNNANTFTTTFDVSTGQAWPRISEGLTAGLRAALANATMALTSGPTTLITS